MPLLSGGVGEACRIHFSDVGQYRYPPAGLEGGETTPRLVLYPGKVPNGVLPEFPGIGLGSWGQECTGQDSGLGRAGLNLTLFQTTWGKGSRIWMGSVGSC